MRTVLQISTHSFVDLITNSSSELFVCNGKKTLKTIKEILQTLLDTHNKLSGGSYTFNKVFGKIFVSKFEFQWWNVPDELRDRYDLYNRYCMYSRNPYTGTGFGKDNPEEKELEKKDREIGQRIGIYEKDLYDTNKKEYDKRWTQYRKEIDVLWTDYGARCLEVEFELFMDFLRQNNFSDKKIAEAKKVCQKAVRDHIKGNHGQYRKWKSPLKFSKDVAKAFEQFEEMTGWGVNCKKGDIFLYSKSDNSIPYNMMDAVSSYLSATRYHLG